MRSRYFPCRTWSVICVFFVWANPVFSDTLPPLTNGQAPQSVDDMWMGFDPRAEPLEVETLAEWEEEGVVLRVVRFHIGTFKGESAKLAAVYGFPKGGSNLPGLVQIHGGGQYADHKACLENGKRGYATISIAWAGRISSTEYRVDPARVQLFWDEQTESPDYRITTDWGALDGYHAPSRNPGNVFPSARAEAWTLDEVESPRNSGWFLGAIAARRALTFLEQQHEVDPDRLGVYGHSMGGKLTVLTAFDERVKAAAPSCGGISDRDNDSALFRATLGDDANLARISCPIIFLSPSNDFHGRIGDLPDAINEIESSDWRVVCSPHHNHQDSPEFEVATMLWFDHHLKRDFSTPRTPRTELVLETSDGVPALVVHPDESLPILSIDVYYTQQGTPNETRFDRNAIMHRFWDHVKAEKSNGDWTAEMPVHDIDRPLWAYANVRYQLPSPVSGAGYYYRIYSTNMFQVSSLLTTVDASQLAENGVVASLESSRLIESFDGNWEAEWFTYRPEEWARSTNKLHAIRYQAPPNAVLTIDVRCDEPNEFVVVIDEYAAEVRLTGREEWQRLVFHPQDFENIAEESLGGWDDVRMVTLAATHQLRSGRGENREVRRFGSTWQGRAPEFRDLRWQVDAR